MEVEGVQPGPEVAAFLLVPDKGRAVVAQVASEGDHVVGSVGEPEHVVTDDFTGGLNPEFPVVGLFSDDGSLFDYKPIQVLPLNLLSSNEVKHERIKTGGPQPTISHVFRL